MLLLCVKSLRLFETPQDAWGPLFMEFSRQEYWSGFPFPPPGDLCDPGIEPSSPVSPALQADSSTTVPPAFPNRKLNVTQEGRDCLPSSPVPLLILHIIGT